jgi:hypothetical protein
MESGTATSDLGADLLVEAAGFIPPIIAATKPTVAKAGFNRLGRAARDLPEGRVELACALETTSSGFISAYPFAHQAIDRLIADLAGAGVLIDPGAPTRLAQGSPSGDSPPHRPRRAHEAPRLPERTPAQPGLLRRHGQGRQEGPRRPTMTNAAAAPATARRAARNGSRGAVHGAARRASSPRDTDCRTISMPGRSVYPGQHPPLDTAGGASPRQSVSRGEK